jgi:hypothetical protein
MIEEYEMVIDESTAKAEIKKQISVLKRRDEQFSQQRNTVKKSRKRWLENTLNYLYQTNIIIGINKNKKGFDLIGLTPVNDKQLEITVTSLNVKKCDMSMYGTKLQLTQHFIIRLMQGAKEKSLQKLANFFNQLFDMSMKAFENFYNLDGIYKLYISGMGVCIAIIEKGELVLKTLIDCDWLTGHKKNVYDTMLYGDNKFYLELPKV